MHAIEGSVFGAILSFLGKAVGFVAEHIWAVTVSVAWLIVGMADPKSIKVGTFSNFS